MAEYISRAALMGELTSSDMQQKIKGMTGADAYNEFLMMVNGTEKADVAEVRRGEWVFKRRYYDADECNCSECGQLMTTHTGKRMNYCPRCGAKMNGGTDNGE